MLDNQNHVVLFTYFDTVINYCSLLISKDMSFSSLIYLRPSALNFISYLKTLYLVPYQVMRVLSCFLHLCLSFKSKSINKTFSIINENTKL